MKGRELLKKGSRWHFGNGTNISVFGDRWVPRPSSFKPIANPLGFDANLRVSDLIDWGDGGWDEDCVREVLLPIDSELVLKMRLCDPTTKDTLLWHYTKDGEFSVKSAYHMWMDYHSSESLVGSPSNLTCSHQLWHKIWAIRVQPHVKSFIWRACWSILPCLKNLKHRKVLVEDLCSCCGAPEDEFHALFHCFEERKL